jgi:transcriptional regulator with XRE-family HTH domain
MEQDEYAELLAEGRAAGPTGRSMRIRKAVKFNQEDLARLAGVSRPAITRWEAGDRIPRAEEAVALARALRRLEELAERVAA